MTDGLGCGGAAELQIQTAPETWVGDNEGPPAPLHAMLPLLFGVFNAHSAPVATVVNAEDPAAFMEVGLRVPIYTDALHAHAVATERGETTSSILAVVDYSMSPDARRMWVVDLARNALLFHEHVSHGKNSGRVEMTQWSDVKGSKQTSIGVSVAAETYYGKHGLSLKMDGLEEGFNANNRERAIVIHGASYVSSEQAETTGRVGNSWGCPAVSEDVSAAMIRTLAGGALVVSWYPDETWWRTSEYLPKRDP